MGTPAVVKLLRGKKEFNVSCGRDGHAFGVSVIRLLINLINKYGQDGFNKLLDNAHFYEHDEIEPSKENFSKNGESGLLNEVEVALESGYITEQLEFEFSLRDYIIDLDNKKFECFEGYTLIESIPLIKEELQKIYNKWN